MAFLKFDTSSLKCCSSKWAKISEVPLDCREGMMQESRDSNEAKQLRTIVLTENRE